LPTSGATSTTSSGRLAAVSATTANSTTTTTTTASSPHSQRRLQSGNASSSFQSPFANTKTVKKDTTKIPSFKAYASPSGEITNRVFQYVMVGSMGLLAAAGAKNTVQGMPYREPPGVALPKRARTKQKKKS
jgi:ubiquinol-cytochrome c reductase iron-sulfur subunit